MRDTRCHAGVDIIEKALTGYYRAEHLFGLEQALALYDEYQQKVSACDMRIEDESRFEALMTLPTRGRARARRSPPPPRPPSRRQRRSATPLPSHQ
jgi:hypothetical protein